MHKPDPKLPPDQQDKRSVVPIADREIDAWLAGTVADAQELLQLTPAEAFRVSAHGVDLQNKPVRDVIAPTQTGLFG